MHVREDILTAIRGIWPTRVLQERLLPQFLGNAKTLERSKARYTFPPVLVLGLSRRLPLTGDEFDNTACDHELILSHRLVWSQILEAPTFVVHHRARKKSSARLPAGSPTPPAGKNALCRARAHSFETFLQVYEERFQPTFGHFRKITQETVYSAVGFVSTAGEYLGWNPHLHILMTDPGRYTIHSESAGYFFVGPEVRHQAESDEPTCGDLGRSQSDLLPGRCHPGLRPHEGCSIHRTGSPATTS